MALLFKIALVLHISGGGIALISGALAMYYEKGAKSHRLAGKFFFWGMTLACSLGIVLSILHPNIFLFLIAIFSYQMTATGYRSLKLKALYKGTLKPQLIDWLIGLLPAIFNLVIIVWGILTLINSNTFGIMGIVFGGFGLRNAILWLQQFFKAPKDKMHWLYAHLQGFGGAYIAAFTAFMVVNINFLPALLVWLLPGILGGFLIALTTNKYKKKFAQKEKVKYIEGVD